MCGWGGGGGGWVCGRGQGGCERRIEVFVKIQKNKIGGGGCGVGWGEGWVGWGGGRLGGGVRVDVIEELKFLGKFTQIKIRGGGGGQVGGVRVDVNEELKFL